MIGTHRTPLIVVAVIILFDRHADYRALAQQIEVPNRVRTSSNVFQDSVDFKVRKFALSEVPRTYMSWDNSILLHSGLNPT